MQLDESESLPAQCRAVSLAHHFQHKMQTAARVLLVCALICSVNATIPSYYQNIDPNAKGLIL
jgi:hypothetical protein